MRTFLRVAGVTVGLVAIVSCGSGTRSQLGSSASADGTASRYVEGGLRLLAHSRGVLVGAAITSDGLSGHPEYRLSLLHDFGMVVPEVAMKWKALRPSPSVYDFTDADALVDFSMSNGLTVRGHTLLWHSANPAWLSRFGGDGRLLLRHHIETVVGRYRGRVEYWDVVNEVLEDDGRVRQSIWHRLAGDDYIDQAFRAARAADPGAKLYLNDYGIENGGPKADGLIELVRRLRARGTPVDGVGVQLHVRLDAPPDATRFAAVLRRLAALRVDVQVTEFDVAIPEPITTEKLTRQGAVYSELMRVILNEPAISAVVFWGFTDRNSWVPIYRTGYNDALLLDREFRRKPAYDGVRSAFAEVPRR